METMICHAFENARQCADNAKTLHDNLRKIVTGQLSCDLIGPHVSWWWTQLLESCWGSSVASALQRFSHSGLGSASSIRMPSMSLSQCTYFSL